MHLTGAEQRVLGSLIEKHLATPQYYPLTLNSLVAACNQSSNRAPVMTLGDGDVGEALTSLRAQGLARVVHGAGSRATKYRHVLDETWGFDGQHLAVLAELLLRGPQTVAELRTRAERMVTFPDIKATEEVLELLAGRSEPLVRLLERRPGQKEPRYAHLLGAEPEDDGPSAKMLDLRSAISRGHPSELPPDISSELKALRDELREVKETVELLESIVEGLSKRD